MKKKKFLSLFLVISILIGIWQTVNAALPSNYDYTGALDKTALFDYIDRKLIEVSDTVFCIGQDKIEYYMTFEDEDRDYPITSSYTYTGKATKTNEQLSELVKQVKEGSLKVKYEHDPSIYDNQVPVSVKSDGKWHSVKTSFDTDKSKWRVINLVEEDYLFFEPTDATRGSWKIYIQGSDDTGKPAFDKISEHYATFKIHKPPIPIPQMIPGVNKITLKDAGSYDYDYQFKKNSKKNIPGDREYSGIKEFYWSVQFDNAEWVDVGTGPTQEVLLNGRTVTDFRLTVEDYDGAFTSISQNALILDKPLVDFVYTVGGSYTTYSYQGNVSHETTKVKSMISWLDEAYNPWLYNTSGARSLTYKAIKTGEIRNSENEYSDQILNPKFASITNSKLIGTELTASNKYDKQDSIIKYLNVKQIDIIDRTNESKNRPGGFLSGSKVKFLINLTSPDSIDYDEFYLTICSTDLKLSNSPLNKTGTNIFEKEITLDQTLKGTLSYTVNVYSKRTNELLHREPGSIIIVNSPPTVEIVSFSPSIIYEGDKVTANIKVNDPDKEPLNLTMTLRDSSNNVLFTKSVQVNPDASGSYPLVRQQIISNISLDTYTLDAIVKDQALEQAEDHKSFTVEELRIIGYVEHTEQWENNRLKYNEAARKAGRKERAANVFFPGERFMLRATTTKIDPDRVAEDGLRATMVLVEIQDKGLNASLSSVNADFTSWTGSIWNESMIKWKDQQLNFIFEATWSNGNRKYYTVPVYIVDDAYWRQHRKD